MKNVKNNIKQIRKDYQLSQNAFGKLIGYSARTISDWELGNTEPSLDAVKLICETFNLEYVDFLDELNFSVDKSNEINKLKNKQNNLRI